MGWVKKGYTINTINFRLLVIGQNIQFVKCIEFVLGLPFWWLLLALSQNRFKNCLKNKANQKNARNEKRGSKCQNAISHDISSPAFMVCFVTCCYEWFGQSHKGKINALWWLNWFLFVRFWFYSWSLIQLVMHVDCNQRLSLNL